jgi:hypothetical protein
MQSSIMGSLRNTVRESMHGTPAGSERRMTRERRVLRPQANTVGNPIEAEFRAPFQTASPRRPACRWLHPSWRRYVRAHSQDERPRERSESGFDGRVGPRISSRARRSTLSHAVHGSLCLCNALTDVARSLIVGGTLFAECQRQVRPMSRHGSIRSGLTRSMA